MIELSPVYVGILLVLSALILGVLAYLFAHLIRWNQSFGDYNFLSKIQADISRHDDAILLVKHGGVLLYANENAHTLFNFGNRELNLERLAQRTHPDELFHGLCAAEGRATFTVNGRLIEGTSFVIPWSENGRQEKATLVSLHLPQITIKKGQGRVAQRDIRIIAEINQAIVTSLKLDETVDAIFKSVERLVSFDYAHIKVLGSSNQPPISFSYSGTSVHMQELWESDTPENIDTNFTNYVLDNRVALLIPDVDTNRDIRPAATNNRYPVKSYLGVPLILADDLIGTLEVASMTREAFSENDQEILLVIAIQAAVAIHSAILFLDEQQRILELSGLAKLAQSVSALRDQKDLFTRLVEGIEPLIKVDVLGFLMYDENQNQISAQVPFIGVPDDFIPLYKIDVTPNSKAASIWSKKDLIESTSPIDDPILQDLGITDMMQAISIHNTVFIRLSSVGGNLGYLQVANKKDGSLINQDDIRLLRIISGQAATILENAKLLELSQERAQRAEALRRIATLMGSVVTIDEVLKYSLIELAKLLDADVGMIMLLDENRAELSLHIPSIYGLSGDESNFLGRISMSDPDYRMTVTGSQKASLSEDIEDTAEILPIYRSIINRLKFRSLVDVPIIVREGGVGEILLGSRNAGNFDRSDLTLLITAAGQLAAALEKSILYTQTDETLRRRVEQLLALTRVGRELNTHLDLERPLGLIYRELLRTTQARCGTLKIFDSYGKATNPYSILLQIGDTQSDSLLGIERYAIDQEESLIINDYEHINIELDDLVVNPPHQGVRSSLIVPVRYEEQTAGIIHLHSKEIGQFDDMSLEIVHSLATQATIALGNAQRYQEQVQRVEFLSQRIDTFEKLLDTYRSLSPNQPLDEALEAIANGIQESTPFNVVIIGIFEPDENTIVMMTGAGLHEESVEELRKRPKSWQSIERILKADFRYGGIFFIPYGQMPVVLPNSHYLISSGKREIDSVGMDYQWHPDDLLLAPLFNERGLPLGLISVDEPRNNLRPDKSTMDALELFASQATLTIENHQQQVILNKNALSVESELHKTKHALQKKEIQLQTLVQDDKQQADVARRLTQKLRSLQAGINLVEAINHQKSRNKVLDVFGEKLLNILDVDIIIIAESKLGKPKLLYSHGEPIDGSVNVESLFGQRNPLTTTLVNGHPLYINNLDDANEWKNSPLLKALNVSGFLCLPIKVKDNFDVSVLMLSHEPIDKLDREDINLFSLVIRQVEITLENLRLLEESSERLRELDLLLDFSRELGTLNPSNILHALLNSARRVVPAGQAGFVALWDDQRHRLVPQVAKGYKQDQRILDIVYRAGEGIPGRAYLEGIPMRVDEIDFVNQYDLSPDVLIILKNATGGLLPVSAIIVPIKVSESILGVLLLENFDTSRAFSEEDQHIITSLVNQTALALENARLYQASEERSLQLKGLTKVASTITSSLQVNEIINLLISQIRGIIPFDTGTLWLRQGELMKIRAVHGFDDSDRRLGLSISIAESALLQEMIGNNKPLNVGDVGKDARFPSLEQHSYRSWLGVPLLSKDEVIGVIALEKDQQEFYSSEHIQAAVTFASQAAVALENANLYEESVRRMIELDERSQRLTMLNRLSTALSGSLDVEHILRVAIDEIDRAIECSAIFIVLFDSSGKAYVRAESAQIISSLPKLLPESPLFDHIRESLGVFSSWNIEDEDMLDSLMGVLTKYKTRSLLVLPLSAGSDLHGLLFIVQEQFYRFSADEIELIRTISNQVAIAIQNAHLFVETERLFSETRQISAELATLFEMGVNITQVLDKRKLLKTTFQNSQQLTQADSIALVVLGDKKELILEAIDKGEWVGPMSIPRNGESLSEYVLSTGEPLLINNFEKERGDLLGAGIIVGEPIKSWLGVPLIVRGSTVGVISVQSYHENAFGDTQRRLLSQVGNQLAVALDNVRLFETVQIYAADLEERVSERTHELEKEHQRLQMLLKIIAELSSSLDLDTVLNQALDIINETLGAEFSQILIYRFNEKNLYIPAFCGKTPREGTNGDQKFSLETSLAEWVLSKRLPLNIPDITADSRWIFDDEMDFIYRSVIAVPLIVGDEVLGAMLLFHHRVNYYTSDQLEIVQAAAKQISVAINNAQLFYLIRDQAERLGEMLHLQHIETSRSNAMLEAVADGVLVTDSSRTITLFNASAEKILDLNRNLVVGRKLEHFSGLFGKQSKPWVKRIRTWSENPSKIAPDEFSDEQVDLDDGRVVSVHVSPVIFRDEFLGTVSIFRDITHMIELDRLKSEFVATVSHELRTPMTSIKGYVEILLMGAAGHLNEQQTHFLEIVKSNNERLAVLVNDLLDISRIEAGKVTLSLQPLDLQAIAKDATQMINRRMQEENRHMEIVIDMPRRLRPAYGDRERVQQIFENLLENAYQYTPESGTIQLCIHEENSEVQIDVKDNGIGIFPDDLERIFERFYRGEDPLILATSGTGLGLSIVKHLVEMHRGRIWAESSGVPGDGSIFSFTLPIYDPVNEPEINSEIV